MRLYQQVYTLQISWIAKVSVDSSETEDVILASQLTRTAGTAKCPGRKDVCLFNITLNNDEVSFRGSWFCKFEMLVTDTIYYLVVDC